MKRQMIKGIDIGLDFDRHTAVTGKVVPMKGLTNMRKGDPKVQSLETRHDRTGRRKHYPGKGPLS
jgi:hypothetical protein